MPHVINGIGTWYWGRRNITTRRAGCEACGAFGDLKSYETTLFFVVLFVPLIPLGRKRVMDECPRCHRHRVAKLGEWERTRIETLESAVSACVAEPNSAEKAIAAVATAIGFRDHKTFLGLVERTQWVLQHHADGQLVLGEGFDFFGDHASARAALRRAAELKGDEESKQILAVHLLRFGNPAEGWALAAPIMLADPGQRLGLALLAVEAFQAAGRHDEAAAVLDEVERAAPQVAGTKDFRAYRKRTRKHAGKTKPVRSLLIGDAADRGAGGSGEVRPRRWAFAGAWVVGPAVLAIIAGLYLLAAWHRGSSREVHIVNGLTRAYGGQVGGRPFSLFARGRTVVRLPEGDIDVHVSDAGLGIPDQTVQIRTNFWTRPFRDRVFVINPDHQAVIIREEAHYSSAPGGGNSDYSLHVGKPLHEFEDVDYEFVPPPKQITSTQQSGTITKVSVQLEGTLEPDDLAAAIEHWVDPEAAREFIERGAVLDDAPAYATMLRERASPVEAIEAVRPALARRPVAMEAHRLYQDSTERARPEHDLVAEYRALLAASPEDPSLAYLLGRVVADRAEAVSLWRRAGEAKPPVALAWGALAYESLARAEYDEAYASIQRGLAIDPYNAGLREAEAITLDALGRMGEWSARPENAVADADADWPDRLDRLYGFVRAGRGPDVRAAIEGWRSELGADGAATVRFAESIVAYCESGEDAYAAALKGIEHPQAKYAAAASAGDLDGAERAAGEIADGWRDPQVRLTLLLVGFRTRRGDELDRLCDDALKALRAGDKEERLAAGWLAGESVPTPEDLRMLAMHPMEKRLALAAIGLRRAEVREACFELARRLNFDRRFPYLVVKAVTEPAGGG